MRDNSSISFIIEENSCPYIFDVIGCGRGYTEYFMKLVKMRRGVSFF